MKISYNWLQNYFEEKLPEPEKISEGIIFHSFEVEEIEKVRDDTVFEIKVLPDRAHDCLSHWGIAKEISAIFDLKIKEKEYKNFEHKKSELQIKIEDEKCLRYMVRIVRNIKIGESPEWLKEKLNAIGQKSINNLVDAGNFVMFDLGQPIHVFDLDKLASPEIIVRNGKVGEKLTTLDKKEINLDESILVIADQKDPLAIAGIKGGTKAEVDLNTKNIVIEVANFNPTTTRKTAKKINILTDAVKRYENEITSELCAKVIDRVTDLIFTIAGGEVEEIIDIYKQKPEKKIVLVSVDYINKRLGSNFSKEEIESVWKKLNFEYTEKENNFEIKVPFLRADITGPHDLSEEVIRILGYDRLEEKLPLKGSPLGSLKDCSLVNEIFYKMLWARKKFLDDGYSEVMTYTFRDNGEVEVLASASDKKFLRTNISDGLKESLKLNQLNAPFLEMEQIKIFEIGTVFKKGIEEMHIAFCDKKNCVEKTLDEFINQFPKENFGAYALGDLRQGTHDALNSPSETFKEKFKMWSVFPFISRDVAVWMPEGESPEKLKQILKDNGTELLIKEPYMFDSFFKDAKTSYAFRLIFQSYDRTLTDEEINEIMTKIGHKISENSSWEIR